MPPEVGKVKVYELEVAPGCKVKVLLLEEFLKMAAPVFEDPVPSVKDEAPVNVPVVPVTAPAELTVKLVNPIRLVPAVVPDSTVSHPDPTAMAFEVEPPVADEMLIPVPEVAPVADSCIRPAPV